MGIDAPKNTERIQALIEKVTPYREKQKRFAEYIEPRASMSEQDKKLAIDNLNTLISDEERAEWKEAERELAELGGE